MSHSFRTGSVVFHYNSDESGELRIHNADDGTEVIVRVDHIRAFVSHLNRYKIMVEIENALENVDLSTHTPVLIRTPHG